MKNILIGFFVLILSGCTVQGWEINKANKFCNEYGGIDYYRVYSGIVMCVDGTSNSIVSNT